MKLIFLTNILLNSLYITNASIDYCDLPCKNDTPNTACDRGRCKPLRSSCKEISTDLQGFRRAILREHNRVRNFVALGGDDKEMFPKAARMNLLEYNEALEFVAQCHVNLCIARPDKCRRTVTFQEVGQNIFFGNEEMLLSETHKIVDAWFSMHRFMRDPVAILSEFTPGMHTPFTQMISENTTHIGCARSFNLHPLKKHQAFMVICNYGPLGYKKGQAIYTFGRPCSRCPGKCDENYNALCLPAEQIIYDINFWDYHDQEDVETENEALQEVDDDVFVAMHHRAELARTAKKTSNGVCDNNSHFAVYILSLFVIVMDYKLFVR